MKIKPRVVNRMVTRRFAPKTFPPSRFASIFNPSRFALIP